MADSAGWRRYFESNARALLDIPWTIGPDLTPDEVAAIASSVQEFQAGERSEGRHLYRAAQDYAQRTGDLEYVAAMRLFIAEEQRHARDLGRVMALNHIPVVDTTFADRVFRRLRVLVPTLEVSIAVLVTAEIIAKVYYARLRGATASRILRRLCDQILRDEQAHVDFQCGQLRRLRAGRGWLASALTSAAQRTLFAGTIVLVGWSHRRVIRRGGMAMGQWLRECWREYALAYAAPPAATASGEIVEGHEAALERLHRGLRPVLDLELGKQPADVRLDGFLADVERHRDVAVRSAQPEQSQHL